MPYKLLIIKLKKDLPWHSNARADNRSTNKNVILITFLIIHHLFSRKKNYHHLSTLSEELKLQWKGLWKTNEHWTKAQFRARSRVFFAGTISSSAAARMTRRMVLPRPRHYALSLRSSLGLLHSSDVMLQTRTKGETASFSVGCVLSHMCIFTLCTELAIPLHELGILHTHGKAVFRADRRMEILYLIWIQLFHASICSDWRTEKLYLTYKYIFSMHLFGTCKCQH